MKRYILAAMLATAGAAQADEGAIRGVIGAQIDAFRADDFAGAFDYAAPNIKGIFGTPDRFGAMVRQGYPMVWRPAEVEYLSAEERGATWQQDVLVTDGAGRLHTLIYTMVETPEGWRIAGVELVTQGQIGV
ncbi:DUF4864 domain-containing protein [uncultured Jannaschia sp.]|uniref:DUF4864 domain-containing protein n=1 Tax=uncultured Jannaschia sp. TaxID=293347 RepID=UPI002630502D|nr:DUF4864 domain-containing protein [uncultured Jannaschia sp.]